MAHANVETLAKAMNISPRRIQQLVGEGMPKAERGAYDIGVCMAWYIRFLQKAIQQRQDPETRADSQELERQRARLAREQADQTALKNAESRGDLVRLSSWERELQKFLAEIRSALLRLPTKVAPELNGDTRQRKQRLEVEVHEVLRTLSEHRPARRAASHSQGDTAIAVDTETAAIVHNQSVGRRPATTQ